ncbi:MAG: primosomal protein N' [Pseudomonadales bacterium]
MPSDIICCIAVPTPLNRLFDYLPPKHMSTAEQQHLQVGQRLRVPFGRRYITGLLLAVKQHTDVPAERLKHAAELIDAEPLLDSSLIKLLRWVADYYHHPLGDTLFGFLPALLRQGRPAAPSNAKLVWRLSHRGLGLGAGALKRAPKQAELLALMQQYGEVGRDMLAAANISAAIVRSMEQKLLVERSQLSQPERRDSATPTKQNKLKLNVEQQQAMAAISSELGSYSCNLLDGVTGSGKTEVYMQLIDYVLANGHQALVLVPEIGLTPQMQQRFTDRFGQSVLSLHSGLSDTERLDNWLQARAGTAQVIVGTRSAVLTPMPRLGLIVIDEEHDGSFKQQDGLRYSARDIAIKRAQSCAIPIVLGSATPSTESLRNAAQRKYRHLTLPRRVGNAEMPHFEIVDTSEQKLDEGLSEQLLQAVDRHLQAGQQVLLFLNRRGFAPTMLCSECGWIAQCKSCDARLTVHSHAHQLRCHHCDAKAAWPTHCPQCKSAHLQALGIGTQRSEAALSRHFPNIPIVRLDRDSTQRRGELQAKLAHVEQGEPCILLGTQMLAKGHHFPAITLVAIIDADAALFSADFRGPERMAQTLTQVAGRAGRASQRGEVLIQSQLPKHPMLTTLMRDGYAVFAQRVLAQRQDCALPPFTRMAMIQAEHKNLDSAIAALQQLKVSAEPLPRSLHCIGPMPAALLRKANRYRAQLSLFSVDIKQLHLALGQIRHAIDSNKSARDLRLSIDVDPMDTY